MCGVLGILNPTSNMDSRRGLIERMIASVRHRGPDGWGVYHCPDLTLGHVRLSIIDLAAGDQPMATERCVIVYNGEVFNYLELKEDLEKRGVRFRTRCDTEVVLRAYEEYGLDCFRLFNGQFGMLIWDRRERKLIAARDRYGMRPLYVLQRGETFYFSSEMKAFDYIDGYRRDLDPERVFEHGLFWNTLGDETVYKDIRSIPGGTVEVFEIGKSPVSHRYYEIGESAERPPVSFDEAKEEFFALLDDSVKLRLRSDVPVADYLSGGIDSSVITHMTALRNKKRFKTFSVAFEDEDFDESGYQREMTEHLNSDHLQVLVDYDKVNRNFLDVVYHTERPLFRTAPAPLYLLAQQVRAEGIKVVLTGEGADEVLWGYDSYKELKLLEFWSRFPDSKMRPLLFKRLYPHLQHYSNSKQFGMMRMFYEEFLNQYDNELMSLNIRVHNNKILGNFFKKDLGITVNRERILEKVRAILPDNFNSWSPLQRNQFLEMKTLLAGYLLSSQGDRMALAHGVEGRYPFLDHRIVEMLFRYPDAYKLRRLSQKHLLRETFRGRIPQSIVDRPKMPYMAPDLKSFLVEGALTPEAREFLSPEAVAGAGLFEERQVERFFRKFQGKTPEVIGYRDNMIVVFLLSCQMLHHLAGRRRDSVPDRDLLKVQIDES